jgi:hypothetical protein
VVGREVGGDLLGKFPEKGRRGLFFTGWRKREGQKAYVTSTGQYWPVLACTGHCVGWEELGEKTCGNSLV